MPSPTNHQFVTSSQYEPEGIFLSLPLEGAARILQGWGEYPDHYRSYTYNGITLKGHTGIDFETGAGAWVLATDAGRVIEISVEPGGFGQYIKLEHAWGESLYAHITMPEVDSGQAVSRGQRIARVESSRRRYPSHLHFAIRITPFNRFDGWGGFSDPLAFLYLPELQTRTEATMPEDWPAPPPELPPVLQERSGMRRP